MYGLEDDEYVQQSMLNEMEGHLKTIDLTEMNFIPNFRIDNSVDMS